MHKTLAIELWRSKEAGQKVRARWKDKSNRRKLVEGWTQVVKAKCHHLDSTSLRAKQDHAQNANGYRFVRSLLDPNKEAISAQVKRVSGGKDWAGGFGPYHEIIGPDSEEMQMEEFVRYIMANVCDKSGRPRRVLARKGILNPTPLTQMWLRHLALHAPAQTNELFNSCGHYLRKRLRQAYPGVAIQWAFHLTTGRPHWEWIAACHHASTKIAARPRWDGVQRSLEHAQSFQKFGKAAKRSVPKLNSQIEIGICQLIERFRRYCESKGLVPPFTKLEEDKAEVFFLQLQEAALMDGRKSQNPLRAKKANALLERIRPKLKYAQRKLEVARLKAMLVNASPMQQLTARSH